MSSNLKTSCFFFFHLFFFGQNCLPLMNSEEITKRKDARMELFILQNKNDTNVEMVLIASSIITVSHKCHANSSTRGNSGTQGCRGRRLFVPEKASYSLKSLDISKTHRLHNFQENFAFAIKPKEWLKKKYVLRFEVGVVIKGDLKGDIYSSIVTFYKLYWWLPFVSFLFTYTFWATRGWFRTPEAARYFLFGIYKRHSSAVSQWPSSHKFKSR